jgi:hypothetical protein
LIKLLTVLFSRLIRRWQESRISALATPTFDVRYWAGEVRKAFAHIELFAF